MASPLVIKEDLIGKLDQQKAKLMVMIDAGKQRISEFKNELKAVNVARQIHHAMATLLNDISGSPHYTINDGDKQHLEEIRAAFVEISQQQDRMETESNDLLTLLNENLELLSAPQNLAALEVGELRIQCEQMDQYERMLTGVNVGVDDLVEEWKQKKICEQCARQLEEVESIMWFHSRGILNLARDAT